MNTILNEYLEKRLTPIQQIKSVKKVAGPVVTISREYGCPAKRLASMLAEELNRINPLASVGNPWTWVGKEIMEVSARELHLKREIINDIANSDEVGILEEILLTFSNKYYPGELKIKKTIGDIILSFAVRGNVIIVGRGGVSICRNIKKSLHIKLSAPLEWRINDVSRRHGLTLDEARHRIKEVDHKRELLRAHFADNHRADDSVFDVVYNYMNCKDEEIVKSVIEMLKMREMI